MNRREFLKGTGACLAYALGLGPVFAEPSLSTFEQDHKKAKRDGLVHAHRFLGSDDDRFVAKINIPSQRLYLGGKDWIAPTKSGDDIANPLKEIYTAITERKLSDEIEIFIHQPKEFTSAARQDGMLGTSAYTMLYANHDAEDNEDYWSAKMHLPNWYQSASLVTALHELGHWASSQPTQVGSEAHARIFGQVGAVYLQLNEEFPSDVARFHEFEWDEGGELFAKVMRHVEQTKGKAQSREQWLEQLVSGYNFISGKTLEEVRMSTPKVSHKYFPEREWI